VPACGGEPGVPAAEAEADGEDRRGARAAQVLDRRAHVGLNSVRRRLREVLHVLEVVASLADARRPAEVVDRDSGDPALGEAQRDLLVEAVEASHVGEDDDAGAARLVRVRGEGCEARAVRRLEHEVLVRYGGT
jgi:hypothetical protein